MTVLKGKADHLPRGVSLRTVVSARTLPLMSLCLAQRQIYIVISIWNLHIMKQYLDTLLSVNILHGSKCCPSILKIAAIPIPAQTI